MTTITIPEQYEADWRRLIILISQLLDPDLAEVISNLKINEDHKEEICEFSTDSADPWDRALLDDIEHLKCTIWSVIPRPHNWEITIRGHRSALQDLLRNHWCSGNTQQADIDDLWKIIKPLASPASPPPVPSTVAPDNTDTKTITLTESDIERITNAIHMQYDHCTLPESAEKLLAKLR